MVTCGHDKAQTVLSFHSIEDCLCGVFEPAAEFSPPHPAMQG
jgi:hypothetical protein